MADHSEHQKKIIKRYYDNRDDIDQERLSEMVTNLYLSDSAKQKDRIWQRAEETMLRLGVPESRVAHILAEKNPAILAEVVADLQSGKI
ncbi:hypothetical protein [Thalassoroseus pseudoceratinae]|uniref:hypothetical protein n=1 Tax=Thalassoroseus pseudoceratinae TaxID=2713176 RepID=UPI00142084FB|nr:hypothetical protein [Thalassoroseus pseudoceratinae]